MVEDGVNDLGGVDALGEHLGAEAGVGAHVADFGDVEAGFGAAVDVLGNLEFADVMEDGGVVECLFGLFVEAHVVGEEVGEAGYEFAVVDVVFYVAFCNALKVKCSNDFLYFV